jgi:fructose/tagatose bisphosphate aldolase
MPACTLSFLAGLSGRGAAAADPADGWAVGAFGACGLEALRAVAEAAEAERAPAVILIDMDGIGHAGLETLGEAALGLARRSAAPMAVQLDRATDLALVRAALDLGFTAVMFDGSGLPFEDNLHRTARAAEMARAAGASIEGELGGTGDFGQGPDGRSFWPGLAARFVRETGVDFLAVPVDCRTGLDLRSLGGLGRAARCPLALHGGRVQDREIRLAIAAGVRKVSETGAAHAAFCRGVRAALARDGSASPMEFLRRGMEELRDFARRRMRLLGSSGKASAPP